MNGKGTFTITISPAGDKIGIDINGITGTKCVDLAGIFTDLGEVESCEKKSEFFVEIPDQILVNG